MSTVVDSTQSSEKIVELLEALRRDHARAESKRQASECELRKMLEVLHSELGRVANGLLKHPVGPAVGGVNGHAAGPAKRAERSGSPSSARESHAAGLEDWEREKERLLQQWSQGDEAHGLRLPDPRTVECSEIVCEDVSNPTDDARGIDWLSYLEHLDPDDPALHDDDVRRQVVARLRRLEVELSLERAQLARMRTELEGRVIEFNHDQRILETKQQAASSRDGRWRLRHLFSGKQG